MNKIIIRIIIAVLIVILASCAGLWLYDKYNYFNYQKGIDNQFKILTPQIKNYIYSVLEGKADSEWEEKGIKLFEKHFDLKVKDGESNDILIWIYKFSDSAYKYTTGYEGGQWQVNLKEEQADFMELPLGETEGMINIFGLKKGPIIVKEFGGQKYKIFDSYFQPSMTWHRRYDSFIGNYSIAIQYTTYDPQAKWDRERAFVIYSKREKAILNKIEKIISELTLKKYTVNH